MGPAGPCTDPKEVAHFPPKRQEASRIQVGKWLLSEVGKQLMHAELALHSTVAQATAHSLECCAVLCLQCPGLHLGSGHQYLPARTPALALPLACLSLPVCHLPAPAVSSFLPRVTWVHGTPDSLLQQGGRETPRPQKIMCPPGGHGGPVGWPLLCPSHQVYIYFNPGPSRQAARVTLAWGHQAKPGQRE